MQIIRKDTLINGAPRKRKVRFSTIEIIEFPYTLEIARTEKNIVLPTAMNDVNRAISKCK